MKHARTVVALMALVLALSVVTLGQKGGKPPSTQPTNSPIPLRVTVYAADEAGNATALRGHPGISNVVYQDRVGGTDTYISRDGDFWFHLDCDDTEHIDLTFGERLRDDPVPPSLVPVVDVPSFEGQMTSFRMMTVGLTGRLDFRTMTAGTPILQPLGVQFWTPVDQYAWNLRYDWDVVPDDDWHGFSETRVEVTAEYDAVKKQNVKWTLTPRRDYQRIPFFGGALFEKYVHHKPDPGYYIDYGTYVMPFRIVLERLQ